ncbi:unnamed protein product [Psylliodes chrysocephalus]|uniref:Uncharacterized protein n=1 Tax=Psylliodes chrysocephalus TaxID=3402493 RepID=A0A9P0GG70_9CUCU|nr:unnamed protein product [Psylliodes chrysocephala]
MQKLFFKNTFFRLQSDSNSISDSKSEHDDYIPTESDLESGLENDGASTSNEEDSDSENIIPITTQIDDNKRKRPREDGNQRELNKKRRMQGEEYVGFRKPKNQKKTYNDIKKPKRILKPRCECGGENKSNRKCKLLKEHDRLVFFLKISGKDLMGPTKSFYLQHSDHKRINA